jgi:hypothetical protein
MSVILTQPSTPMGPRVKLLASSQRRLDQGQHGLKEWPGAVAVAIGIDHTKQLVNYYKL